jgi:hypothetical protein
MDLLTTYTHDSELQAINSATANLYNSQITTVPAKPFQLVFTRRSPATASNSAVSSASRAKVLSSQPPVQNSTDL